MLFKRAPIQIHQQNPWGKPSGEQPKGPPELDQLFKRFFRSGQSDKSSASKSPQAEPKRVWKSWGVLAIIILVLLVLWGFSGLYTVAPNQQAGVLRLGQWQGTEPAGQHWYPRFIDQVYLVNIKPTSPLADSQTIVTQAGDVVDVQWSASYQVQDVKAVLFAQTDPINVLQSLVEQAVQQTLSSQSLDTLLSQNTSALEATVSQAVQSALASSPLGVSMTQFQFASISLPSAVQADYQQVTQAQNTASADISAAKAYAESVTPVATEKNNALLAAAKAYQQKVILKANTDIAEFEALLPVYQQYPAVTKTRMYFDAMQKVLQHSQVVVLDGGDKGNTYYLPLGTTTPVMTNAAPVAISSEPNASNVTQQTSSASKTSNKTAADYVRWEEAQE